MLAHSFAQVANLKVTITTHLDSTITGFIYTYADDILVLRMSGKDQTEEIYRFINTLYIKLLEVLGSLNKQRDGAGLARSDFKKIALDEFQRKLENAITLYDNRTHPKATTKAQLLFKKLVEKWGVDDVRWQDSDIVIKDEIRLTKPYTLGKNTMHKLKRNAVHLEEIKKHIREVWLEIDSRKRGG